MQNLHNQPVTLDPTYLKENIENGSVQVPPHKIVNIYDIRSSRRRFFIMIIFALVTVILTFTDTIYLPALGQIEIELHATNVLVDYTISGYLVEAGLFSLLWGPLGDRFGRKIILLISLISFVVVTIVCVFIRTIIMLLIFRGLQGAAISATLVLGQSAIVDMYPHDKLGSAMGIYFAPMLVGPIICPLIGGALTEAFGWRSTFILLAIMAVVAGLFVLIFVPETHHYFVVQRNLQETQKKLSKSNSSSLTYISEADKILKPTFSTPWRLITLLADRRILPHILVCNMNFSVLFILLTLMSHRESEPPYLLVPLQIGFTYIATSTGSLLGSVLGGWLSDWSAKHFGSVIESRLMLNLLVSFLCPFGILLCGWTFHFGVHLAVPLIGGGLFCFGEMCMYTSVCAFINVKNSSAAGCILALLNSMNFVLAGIGIIVVSPLLAVMKYGPLFSVLAAIIFVPLCFSSVTVLYEIRLAKSTNMSINPLPTMSKTVNSIVKSEDVNLEQMF